MAEGRLDAFALWGEVIGIYRDYVRGFIKITDPRVADKVDASLRSGNLWPEPWVQVSLADDDPNWRTKRLILTKYDELAQHARAGTTYVSPDPPPPLPEKLRLSGPGGGHA